MPAGISSADQQRAIHERLASVPNTPPPAVIPVMTIPAIGTEPEARRRELLYQQAFLQSGGVSKTERTLWQTVTAELDALTAYFTANPEPLADVDESPSQADNANILDQILAFARSTPVNAAPPSGSTDIPEPLETDESGGLFGLSKTTVYLLGAAAVVIGVAFFFIVKK